MNESLKLISMTDNVSHFARQTLICRLTGLSCDKLTEVNINSHQKGFKSQYHVVDKEPHELNDHSEG